MPDSSGRFTSSSAWVAKWTMRARATSGPIAVSRLASAPSAMTTRSGGRRAAMCSGLAAGARQRLERRGARRPPSSGRARRARGRWRRPPRPALDHRVGEDGQLGPARRPPASGAERGEHRGGRRAHHRVAVDEQRRCRPGTGSAAKGICWSGPSATTSSVRAPSASATGPSTILDSAAAGRRASSTASGIAPPADHARHRALDAPPSREDRRVRARLRETTQTKLSLLADQILDERRGVVEHLAPGSPRARGAGQGRARRTGGCWPASAARALSRSTRSASSSRSTVSASAALVLAPEHGSKRPSGPLGALVERRLPAASSAGSTPRLHVHPGGGRAPRAGSAPGPSRSPRAPPHPSPSRLAGVQRHAARPPAARSGRCPAAYVDAGRSDPGWPPGLLGDPDARRGRAPAPRARARDRAPPRRGGSCRSPSWNRSPRRWSVGAGRRAGSHVPRRPVRSPRGRGPAPSGCGGRAPVAARLDPAQRLLEEARRLAEAALVEPHQAHVVEDQRGEAVVPRPFPARAAPARTSATPRPAASGPARRCRWRTRQCPPRGASPAREIGPAPRGGPGDRGRSRRGPGTGRHGSSAPPP